MQGTHVPALVRARAGAGCTTAARRRMAETGEPYSVARRAVKESPAPGRRVAAGTTSEWNEQYYADGAASEGITVEVFKARRRATSAS